MPSARPKSLVVSVFPVPAGPAKRNKQKIQHVQISLIFNLNEGKILPAGPPPITKCNDCVSVI